MSTQLHAHTPKASRRFDAPPAATHAGFELWHADGITLLRRDEEDGSYTLIGHILDGAAGDPSSRNWNVGRYSDRQEGFVEISGYGGRSLTLSEAIDASALLPEPDGEERSYDTLDEALADRPSFRM